MRLTSEQRAAAAPSLGAVRVVAGAGTGKTAVLAERFRLLVAAGADPASILVLTFTERAAAEMAARMTDSRGDTPPQVGTFHSLALRWLREEGRAAGLPRHFAIEAGADRWIALRELMWELGDPVLVGVDRPDDLVTPLLRLSERLKQELVPLDRLEAWCRDADDRERAEHLAAAARLLREHGSRQRARGVLEFDDLLVEAVRLLEARPAVLARFRKRYRHLMVDEYQDTNLAQERLVELLVGEDASVLVVGDDDQSIYRFRGASLASMERFAARFPAAVTRTLGVNRRSGRRIVEAAAALVSANPARLPKELRAAARSGEAVRVLECSNGMVEAEALAAQALAAVAEGVTPERIAILARTHAAARPLAAALRAAGLNVRHAGAAGVWQRPAARDVLAMLRLSADRDAAASGLRLVDRWGGDLESAARLVEGEGPPVLERLAAAADHPWAAALAPLAGAGARLGVDQLFFDVMEATGYLAWPHRDPEEVRDAIDAVTEAIDDFCATRPDQSLAAFLARAELVELSGIDDEPRRPPPEAAEPAIQVMSIHQSKGLEFDVVLVPGLVEGRLPQPHRREVTDLPSAVVEPAVRRREDHVAEERRLLYVAMTRARRRLVLSWAPRYEGSRTWTRSRFLDELESAGGVKFETAGSAEPEALAPGAAPGPERPVTLSFSGISAYRECPRQYWFRTQVRPPVRPSPEAQYGVAVHRALASLGARAAAGEPVGRVQARAAVEAAWAELPPTLDRRAPALLALSHRQVDAFVDGGGFVPPPLHVEQRFTAEFNGWRLRGALDRVDAADEPGARWRLVDYKTGNPLPASRLRRDLQLALYALGARATLDLEGEPDLELVYLRTGKTVAIQTSDELYEAARLAGTEVAAGVAGGRFEARPERRRCALCAYRVPCADSL